MTDEELRKLQLYGLEILKDVDKFCKKNNIKYCLGEGTLLGAVRHHGFIPWDDDIDILMTRENFDKFVSKYQSKNYELEYFNTIPDHWVPFAKVRIIRETEFMIPTRTTKTFKYKGPRIDVFPLDYVPCMSSKKQDFQWKKIKFWKSILKNKVLAVEKKKKKYYYLIYPIARMFPYKLIVKIIKNNLQNYDSSCKFIANKCSAYPIKKETFPKEYYEDLINIKFEDQNFPVPREYDKVLTQIYGDYMTPPKLEDRKRKHNVKVRK